MKNLNMLEEFIKEEKGNKEMYTRFLKEADQKYVGETLEKETKKYAEYISEAEVKINAHELLKEKLEEGKLSACCGAPITMDKAFCSQCKEHV